jgi:hypothetical protein
MSQSSLRVRLDLQEAQAGCNGSLFLLDVSEPMVKQFHVLIGRAVRFWTPGATEPGE